MSSRTTLALIFTVSCAGTPVEPADDAALLSPPAAAGDRALAIVVAPRQASPQRPCPRPGRQRSEVPPPVATCEKPAKKLALELERALTKDFQPTHVGGRPVVAHACDGLSNRIASVSIERGDPLGLDLWHASLDRDGEAYEIRGVTYDTLGYAPPPAPHGPPWFKLASGRMPRALLGPVIEEARRAAAATIAERAPPNAKLATQTVRMCGSSYLVVTFVDDEGRVIERRNVAGLGSISREQQPGLALAFRRLEPMRSFPAEPGEPGEDLRAFVAARMQASSDSFATEYRVAEHYAHLAPFFVAPEVLPALLVALPVLTKERPRTAALDALTQLTGWDARTVEGGTPKTFEAARSAYLEACSGPAQ